MAQRKARSTGGSDRRSGTGCLIWLVLFLVTLLLFVFNWEKIQSTLQVTGFREAVGAPSGADKPRQEPAKGDGSLESPATEDPAKPQPQAKPAETTKPGAATQAPSEPARPAQGADPAPAPAKDPQKEPLKPKPADTVSPMEAVKTTRVAVLYFIRVDDDGAISRREVKRTVNASDSPMSDALDALMAGPNADELGRGYISLIPSEARLLSAQVRGSTAYLNFSEAFMYNRYGIEGYAGQLKQIVYTATSFSTVKDVQILIDGQKRDYLGGDGVYIGKPLSRASF
jgi:hypothetical protein